MSMIGLFAATDRGYTRQKDRRAFQKSLGVAVKPLFLTMYCSSSGTLQKIVLLVMSVDQQLVRFKSTEPTKHIGWRQERVFSIMDIGSPELKCSQAVQGLWMAGCLR